MSAMLTYRSSSAPRLVRVLQRYSRRWLLCCWCAVTDDKPHNQTQARGWLLTATAELVKSSRRLAAGVAAATYLPRAAPLSKEHPGAHAWVCYHASCPACTAAAPGHHQMAAQPTAPRLNQAQCAWKFVTRIQTRRAHAQAPAIRPSLMLQAKESAPTPILCHFLGKSSRAAAASSLMEARMGLLAHPCQQATRRAAVSASRRP
mmetsp:Transcript_19562/g.58031  ORF Transcript_19562/g.58031 Transcript_19562/m.58031 type:complete len:204 (+) Transcript_19562:170-781(+)